MPQQIKNSPLVSIIVITYNSAKYVLETLESAKTQTYQNIELIVTDDCSTDNTVSICKQWIEENKGRFVRTRLITVEKNDGIPANCNRGIDASRGNWIKLIAGDDILEKNCIDDNVDFALKNSSFFVFSELTYFSEKNFKYADDIKDKALRQKFSELGIVEQLKFYSRYPMFLNSPSWFFRKNKIAKFDEDFKYLEDQPFIFRLLSENINIAFFDKGTVKYRRHEDSVQKMNPKLTEEFVFCYKKYRNKNLRFSSLIDFLFIINFRINNFVMKAPSFFLIRYMLVPIRKLNPVVLFKISPACCLNKVKQHQKSFGKIPRMKNKIRVLWFTGMPIGYVKPGEKLTHGGWMSELKKQVEQLPTIDLAIAFHHTDSVLKNKIGNVTYYPLTKQTGAWASLNRFLFFRNQENHDLQKMIRVIDDFQPDIIHVFGTEEIFGIIAPHVKVPVVIHIQGLMIPCLNAWFPPYYSKKDIKGLNNFRMFLVSNYQAEREKRILSGCRYFMGRTEWDKNVSRLFSPHSTYFHCDEMLRNEFYEAPYTPKTKCAEKLRLISVISTPLYKGNDVILKTAKLLKEKLSVNFVWKVFGILEMHLHEKKWGISSIKNNIQFMGRVPADNLVKEMQQSDIYIHPSYIDNSPNSVCEAQLLGLPIIASNVGGVASLITNEQNGILVPSNDPFQLASYVYRLMKEPALYESIGKNGRITALKRHSQKKIINDLINVYSQLLHYE